MHCTEAKTIVAVKRHICMNCGEPIESGDTYKRWVSFDDGSAGTNKMHPECLQALNDENGYGTWEYSPYSGERPMKGGA